MSMQICKYITMDIGTKITSKMRVFVPSQEKHHFCPPLQELKDYKFHGKH